MFKKLLPLSLFAAFFFISPKSFSSELSDLKARVEELERQQEEMLLESNEQATHVNSFLRDNLTLGGFFEPAFTGVTGPDTEHQLSNNANTLGLNISAQFKEKFRFVTQLITGIGIPLQNLHNNPAATSLSMPAKREFTGFIYGSLIAQAYIEYSLSDNVRLQSGLGYVPFGHSLQQREPVLFERRGGPQLNRMTDLLSPLWGGLHLLGAFSLKKSHWGYNLYSTGFANVKIPGVGGRVWWTSANEKLSTGISTQIGKRGQLSFKTVGADIRAKIKKLTITSEYVRSLIEGPSPWTVYLEPSMPVYKEEIIIYVHGDYAESTRNVLGTAPRTIPDPYKRLEYGGGVNWLPTSFTRFRIGVSYNNYVGENAVISGQDRDYLSYDLSAGVAF